MKIHDRRSKDVLRNRSVSIMEVDDPYERGEKIVVSRQLRGDPLGRLHAHGRLTKPNTTPAGPSSLIGRRQSAGLEPSTRPRRQ
jgi:hypothetical protein